MKNVITQLQEALSLLAENPNIEEIISIKDVKQFLENLLSIAAIADLTDFSKIKKEEIEIIAVNFQNRQKEWENAIRNIHEAIEIDNTRNSPNEVISAFFPADLSELARGGQNGWAIFYCHDKAKLDILFNKHFKTMNGTWLEIYNALVKYVKENLKYPDLPQTKKKKT